LTPSANFNEKAPTFNRGPFSLLAFFDDGFASRPVIVFFLDNGSAIGGLAFLDYGGPLAIPVTIVVAALANSHASACRPDANTHTKFFR
jgi:hypothetical protein